VGIASLLLTIALVGCASKPGRAPASKSAARSAPSAASAPAEDAQPKKKPKKTASAKAAPPAAQAPAEKSPPVGKAERNFLRPATGSVIAQFNGRANKGVDFAGSKGDPVYASRDGKVVYAAATLRGYGQLVMIKHDAHYVTAYAHNSQLLVKEGQSVKRGQMIARMGSTETDRVKLHFELRRDGSAVDPMSYFGSGERSD
jgi:lipoprotein NlpD